MIPTQGESIKHIVQNVSPLELPYISEETGFELDAVISVYSQVNQYPERSGNPPASIGRIREQYYQFWQEGHSIIDIASWLGRHPSSLLKLVLDDSLTRLTQLDASTRKKMVHLLLAYPMYSFLIFHHCQDVARRLWDEIRQVLYTLDSTPYIDKLRNHLGQSYEIVMHFYVSQLHHPFLTDVELRGQHKNKTPDFLFLSPVLVFNRLLNWLDSKMLYGNSDAIKTTQKQLQGYTVRFSQGAAIFWPGTSSQHPFLASSRHARGELMSKSVPSTQLASSDDSESHSTQGGDIQQHQYVPQSNTPQTTTHSREIQFTTHPNKHHITPKQPNTPSDTPQTVTTTTSEVAEKNRPMGGNRFTMSDVPHYSAFCTPSGCSCLIPLSLLCSSHNITTIRLPPRPTSTGDKPRGGVLSEQRSMADCRLSLLGNPWSDPQLYYMVSHGPPQPSSMVKQSPTPHCPSSEVPIDEQATRASPVDPLFDDEWLDMSTDDLLSTLDTYNHHKNNEELNKLFVL